MPFFNIFKSFTLNSHQRKKFDTHRSSLAQGHRNYNMHDRVRVEDDVEFELDTRSPQRWHTAESLLECHEFATNRDQYINSPSHKLPHHPEPSDTLKSWSPIPSVHRYPPDIDTLTNSTETSQRPRDVWKHVVDGRKPTLHQDFGNSDAHIPVAHAVHAREMQHSTISEDGWYREEMDRRERFRNPDVHITRDSERTLTYQNRTKADGKKKSESFNSGMHLPNTEVIGPTIYQHEVWNIGDPEPELYYYIVPGGMNVIFKDETGNEVSRVGRFGKSVKAPRRISPTIVQDEHGNELYRTGDFGRLSRSKADSDNERVNIHRENQRDGSHTSPRIPTKSESSVSYASVPSDATNIILIDDHGYQIPILLIEYEDAVREGLYLPMRLPMEAGAICRETLEGGSRHYLLGVSGVL